MILRATIEAEAEPEVAAALLASAIMTDLLAGPALPEGAFSWDGDGMPHAAMVFQEDEEGGPDVWPRPVDALKRGRGDCATLVRLYGQVWGDAVAVTPLNERGKLHAELVEGAIRFDPAALHGMEGEATGPLTLAPIVRPKSGLGSEAEQLSTELHLAVSRPVLERLALASRSPSRLGAMAKQLSSDPVAGAVVALLKDRASASRLLSGRGRPAAAVALSFVLTAVPGYEEGIRVPRISARVDGLDALGELLPPGCRGGCGL